MANNLEGVIDLHIHIAPDIRERKMGDLELMEAAVKNKARAVVIKSHHLPTASRAAIVNKVKREKYPDSNFEMFGSVTLNRFTGGINPYTVETALKLGAKIVWLPTLTAENHIVKQGNKSRIPPVEVVKNGHVVPELLDVFKLINDFDAVLATGHISPEECFIVTEAARNSGVKKIVITHPEFWVVGMSLTEQQRIVNEFDVLLEHEYAQPTPEKFYVKNLEANVEAMKAIGCEHFIVATDSGQTQNPYWHESLSEYIDYLRESGFSKDEIDTMTKTNPAKMLGL